MANAFGKHSYPEPHVGEIRAVVFRQRFWLNRASTQILLMF
jgi:hypothetical protein